MTDKEKQIEELARLCCLPCEKEYCGRCIEGFDPGRCTAALDTAEAIYNAGYRKQVEGEWISVDDRLPDKKTMVLGFVHNVYGDGSCWDNILVMELNVAGYFVPFNCSEIKDNRVTHWMPLPEPPKMKGGESDA